MLVFLLSWAPEHILRWTLLNEALWRHPKSMPTVGIMWHFTPHNIQINMFCLHATGQRTLEEIRWCLSLHVEQLSSPYVYANKSKTNGALSRDTGKRRDVEMLNIYRSRRKPKTAPAGNKNLPAGHETCRRVEKEFQTTCGCGRGSDTRGEWKNERPLIRHNPQWEVVKSN